MPDKEFFDSWQFVAILFGGLFVGLWVAIKTGMFITPGKDRELKQKEAEEYESLSPEGKLLHKLVDKQEQTEVNTRAIYGAIMGGAIGILVYTFWPF